MTEPIGFLFPGQGSQFAGMGRDLAEAFPEAAEVFARADDALGFSLSSILFEGPEETLRLTEHTQPAILTMSSALMAVILSRSDRRPTVVAGHSLGEYSAVVAAGGLVSAEAASIVRARGRFMQSAVPVGTGAMAAIIGPSLDEIQSLCDASAEGDILSPANINAPGQIVIAGSKAAVDRAIALAKERGIRKSLLLPVSAPFHCALMKPAEESLRPVLEGSALRDLNVPLISNVDAKAVTSRGDVLDGLLRQVASPVRWVEVVEKMISMGVRKFVEIGPGTVLAGLVRRIDKDTETIAINSAATLETYLDT